MTYISWFNHIRTNAKRKGLVINDIEHKLSPIPNGKSWVKGKCPKCESDNGFVFQSDNDPELYVLFCQRCNKFSVERRKAGVKENSDGTASFTGHLVGMGL